MSIEGYCFSCNKPGQELERSMKNCGGENVGICCSCAGTGPKEKTCYSCRQFELCFLRRAFWDIIIGPGGGMVKDDTQKRIFEIVAADCKKYKKE